MATNLTAFLPVETASATQSLAAGECDALGGTAPSVVFSAYPQPTITASSDNKRVLLGSAVTLNASGTADVIVVSAAAVPVMGGGIILEAVAKVRCPGVRIAGAVIAVAAGTVGCENFGTRRNRVRRGFDPRKRLDVIDDHPDIVAR